MSVRTVLGKRAAAITLTAVVGLGLAACAAPPTASGGGPSDPQLSAMFSALNQDRAASGLPALSWSPQLANLAGNWAVQMGNVNSLYHQNLGAILNSADYAAYHTLGENILVGPGGMSASSMEAAWMASPGHRANIQNGNFNVVGIGLRIGPDGRSWAVQDFGGL